MANKYSPYPGDIVDAKLEPGEYVLNRNAVKEIGVKKLNKLNNKIAPRFPKGYQTGGQAFEDLPEYADNGLIERARQMVHKAKMSYHAKKDPQLKAYLEGSGIDWQGAIAEGQSASKFLEDNGGSSDSFDSTQSTRFTRGPLKGATLSDRFTEDVVDGDYSKAKVNNDFLLKTKKHPAGYDLEQYKMFGKVKRQTGGLMEKVHLGLDAAGMIPGVGVPADILNSALYGGEALMAGDPLERKEALSLMGLSAASAIPFIGQGATAGKYAHKANKVLKSSKVTSGDRAKYYRALKKQDDIANPKYNKYMNDAHIGGKNPYKYDKPKFADPLKRQIVGRDGIDKISGLPVEGHKAGFQEGGKIGPGEQARLEAEHMLQAQQMAKFDQYKREKGIPMGVSEEITLPTSPGAQFSTKDFDKYLGQYADLNDLSNSRGEAPWDEGFGELPGIGMDHEIPGMNLTGSEQILTALKAGKLGRINESNPAVEKALEDNPKLGFEYNKQMDAVRDKYGPKDMPMLDSEIAYNTDGSISDSDDAYLQHKLAERDKRIELEERAKYLKDNPEAMAEHQKKLDAQGSMYDGMDEAPEMKPLTKREQVLAELKRGMAGNQDGYNNLYKLSSPGKGIKKHFDKLEKKVDRSERKAERKRKRTEFFNKVKKKIGTFDDAKAGFKGASDARKKYNEEKMKKEQMQQGGFLTRMQKGGYMRPDGKQGYFAGALVAAAPALMGALGLGGGAAAAGTAGAAGAAGSGTLLGKLGGMGANIGGNYLEAGKGLNKLGNMSMGEGKGNAGSFLGSMLQHAASGQLGTSPKSNQEAVKLTGINSDDSDDVASGNSQYDSGSVIDATAEQEVERQPVMTQQEGGYIGSLEGFIQQSWRNMR